MNFLLRLEQTLENLIEKTILSPFKGRLQPIEIARALWREISLNKRTGLNENYIPNYFTVTLPSSDAEFFEPVKETVEREIINHLLEECKKRNFKPLAPMTIQWVEDETVRDGEFFISSAFVETVKEPSPEKGHREYHISTDETINKETKIAHFQLDEDRPLNASLLSETNEETTDELSGVKALLRIAEGFGQGEVYKVKDGAYTLGRSEDCNIPVWDPRVSRNHAIIACKDNRLYIKDNGSRTGVYVNKKQIRDAYLADNDEITLGVTTIKVKLI